MFTNLTAPTKRTRPVVIRAIIVLGAVLTTIGFLQASKLLHLISLESQGKCDWVPCADTSTYWTAGIFALVGLIGLALVLAGAVLWLYSRKQRQTMVKSS